VSLVVDHAKEYVEHIVAQLPGDGDFVPFILTRRGTDEGFFGIAGIPDDNLAICDVMVAATSITRAQEAVFGSPVWLAPGEQDGTLPENHPEREEVVMLLHCTGDGDAAHLASIHRADGKVTLGPWQQGNDTHGPYAEALHLGMRLASKMTPEIAAAIQDGLETGDAGEMMRGALEALGNIRQQQAKSKEN